jgi:hypothetical protein
VVINLLFFLPTSHSISKRLKAVHYKHNLEAVRFSMDQGKVVCAKRMDHVVNMSYKFDGKMCLFLGLHISVTFSRTAVKLER